MPTYEHSGVFSYKDENNNNHLLYPVTKKDNVEGMEDIDQHVASKNNPHGVTAAQAGALPEDGTAAAAKTLAATVIPENADLNDYVTPGWYQCEVNATAATLENCPTNEAFSLEVVPSSKSSAGNKGVIQRIASYRPPNVQIWCRNIHGTTYGEWVQVYTTANKPSAVDIGVSNPNLVDNWYFVDPVNQRGEIVYTTAGYTIDRWKLTGNANASPSVSLTSNGVKLNRGTGALYFTHDIEQDLTGKVVTFSLLTDGGELFSMTVTCKKLNVGAGNGITNTSFGRMYQSTSSSSSSNRFVIAVEKVDELTIKAVKVELGSVQTLARQKPDGTWELNDPPPNKALELLKCQRYYWKSPACCMLALEKSSDTTGRFQVYIQPKTEMRIKPDVTVNGKSSGEDVSFRCTETNKYVSGALAVGSSFSTGTHGVNRIGINNLTGEYIAGNRYEGTIELSADL